MSAPYVPASAAELAGYLASIVKRAAEDYPGDEAFTRGLAACKAWVASREALDDVPVAPANPDRRCRYCGATSGLKMLHTSPLTLAAKEWQCWDGCRDSAR